MNIHTHIYIHIYLLLLNGPLLNASISLIILEQAAIVCQEFMLLVLLISLTGARDDAKMHMNCDVCRTFYAYTLLTRKY